MADVLKDVLVKVIENLQDRENNDPVKQIWQEIIDKKTRRHARPSGIKQGVLRIIVDSSAQAYDLNLRKKTLVDKFNERGVEVKNINFRVGKVEAE